MKKQYQTKGQKQQQRKQETQNQKIARISRKQMLLISNKVLVTANSATTGDLINHNGTVFSLLANLARGDNSLNNFRGDSLTPLSLKLRYGLLGNDQPQAMRVIIFQWFQSSVPSVAGVLDTPNTFLGTPLAPYSDKQFDNRKTYKVLYDKLHGLTNTGAGDQNIFHVEDVFLPMSAFKNIEFVFNSASPQTGGIYLCVVSDSAAVPHPSITYVSAMICSDN